MTSPWHPHDIPMPLAPGSLAVSDPFSTPTLFAFPNIVELGQRLRKSNRSRRHFDQGMASQPLALWQLFQVWSGASGAGGEEETEKWTRRTVKHGGLKLVKLNFAMKDEVGCLKRGKTKRTKHGNFPGFSSMTNHRILELQILRQPQIVEPPVTAVSKKDSFSRTSWFSISKSSTCFSIRWKKHTMPYAKWGCTLYIAT